MSEDNAIAPPGQYGHCLPEEMLVTVVQAICLRIAVPFVVLLLAVYLAITIDAPSHVVWKWLVQIGQDRAGFYSYTWLENLVGAISVLGLLMFGRQWWGSFLVVGSVVLLTLLLASDADIAIGRAFAVLLLAIGGASLAGRPAHSLRTRIGHSVGATEDSDA